MRAVIPRSQSIMRRTILLGTPLLLMVLELAHPLLDHVNTITMLTPIATWWIVLHLLLVPLFILMGWSFYLLLQNIDHWTARLSRIAVVVYIAVTIGYDMAVGLTSGIIVSNAIPLPQAQKTAIQRMLFELFGSPAITLSYLLLVAAGITVVWSTVWALAHIGVPRLPLIVFLGTIFSVYSHALPFGPLGSMCFFLAVAWIELVWRGSAHDSSSLVSITTP